MTTSIFFDPELKADPNIKSYYLVVRQRNIKKKTVSDSQSQTQSLTKTKGFYNFCGFLRPHDQGLQ